MLCDLHSMWNREEKEELAEDRAGGRLGARMGCGKRAQAGEHGHLLVHQLLREPEVGQLHMPVPVQQNVLRLQVTVHDLLGVQVLQGTDDLGRVEEPRVVGEAAAVAQVAEQLAAGHELHQHVEEALVVARPEPAWEAGNEHWAPGDTGQGCAGGRGSAGGRGRAEAHSRAHHCEAIHSEGQTLAAAICRGWRWLARGHAFR